MTMAIGFILGDHVYLAADKRTTQLRPDGSNGEYTDKDCKILSLSPKTFMFCGGIVQATTPLKARIIKEFAGSELNSKDFERISFFCQDEYEKFMRSVTEELKASQWLKDFTISVIIAQNLNGKPSLTRFDSEVDFKPITQINNADICVKSAIQTEILWPKIEMAAAKTNTEKVFDPIRFINRIFVTAAKAEKTISEAYDIFIIPPIVKKNPLSFQKLTSGTITATISINSPTINGGTITGPTIQTAASGARVYVSPDSGVSLYDTNGYLKIQMNHLANGSKIDFYEAGWLKGQVQALSDVFAVYPVTAARMDLGVSTKPTYAWGDWDFSHASVTGLPFATENYVNTRGYITSSAISAKSRFYGYNYEFNTTGPGGSLQVWENGVYQGAATLDL